MMLVSVHRRLASSVCVPVTVCRDISYQAALNIYWRGSHSLMAEIDLERLSIGSSSKDLDLVFGKTLFLFPDGAETSFPPCCDVF